MKIVVDPGFGCDIISTWRRVTGSARQTRNLPVISVMRMILIQIDKYKSKWEWFLLAFKILNENDYHLQMRMILIQLCKWFSFNPKIFIGIWFWRYTHIFRKISNLKFRNLQNATIFSRFARIFSGKIILHQSPQYFATTLTRINLKTHKNSGVNFSGVVVK